MEKNIYKTGRLITRNVQATKEMFQHSWFLFRVTAGGLIRFFIFLFLFWLLVQFKQ